MGSIKFIIDSSFESFCEDIRPYLQEDEPTENIKVLYDLGVQLLLQENMSDFFREQFVEALRGSVWTYEAWSLPLLTDVLRQAWDKKPNRMLVITDVYAVKGCIMQCDVAFVESDLFKGMERREKLDKTFGKSYKQHTNQYVRSVVKSITVTSFNAC